MSDWCVDNTRVNNYINIVQKAIINDVVFNTFRNNNDYCQIVSNYMPEDEWRLYNDLVTNNKFLMEKFDTIKLMDQVGNPELYGKKTAPHNLRYMYNTLKIKEYFGNINNVVEIGVGYGGMCFVFNQYNNLFGYHLVDLDCCQSLAKLVLSKLPMNTTKEFFNEKSSYDLCISEHALSELSDQLINNYYERYLSKSKYLFLRTNFEHQKDRGFEYMNSFIKMLEKNFIIKVTTDFPNNTKCPVSPFVILGCNKSVK